LYLDALGTILGAVNAFYSVFGNSSIYFIIVSLNKLILSSLLLKYIFKHGFNSLNIRLYRSDSAVNGSVYFRNYGNSFLSKLVDCLIVPLSSSSYIILFTINLNSGILYGHYTVRIKILSYTL